MSMNENPRCSLIQPENIEELVNLVTQEPSDYTDEKTKYKWVARDIAIRIINPKSANAAHAAGSQIQRAN